ncbi:MAG: hypothetical protein HOP07_12620 [Bacteriovoracaceae bacterium]|nr:hypothetical protein [Bacteriovoracaceae bacterium]
MFIFILMISLPIVVWNAENKKVCASLDTNKIINVTQICVGDMSLHGKVTEIIKPAIGPITYMVLDEQTKEIKKLNNIVLKELGTCASKDQMSFCIGQTVVAYDGSKEIVAGFITPEHGYKKVFVRLASATPGKFSYLSVEDVMEQVQISQTGFVKAVGICHEGGKLNNKKLIEECAKNDLQRMAHLKCNLFQQGNGKIIFDIKSLEIKTNCQASTDKKPLMWCKADSFVKCDSDAGVLKSLSRFMSQFKREPLQVDKKLEILDLDRNPKKVEPKDLKTATKRQNLDQ